MTVLLLQLVTVDFEGVPLRDALASLGVTLEGKGGDEPVTLRLTEVRRSTPSSSFTTVRGPAAPARVVTKLYDMRDRWFVVRAPAPPLSPVDDVDTMAELIEAHVPGTRVTRVKDSLLIANSEEVHRHVRSTIRWATHAGDW